MTERPAVLAPSILASDFSRLGEDLHIDPLLKDYLSFARQQYVDNPTDGGEITPDNLPGRRKSKKSRSELPTEATINFANLVFDHQDISQPFDHHLPTELEPESRCPAISHQGSRYRLRNSPTK